MPKAEKKKQDKIIEDRTFGLKNKNKSKTVQKFIKGVQNTVKNDGKSAALLQSEKFQSKKAKQKKLQEQALLNALYKDVGKLNQVSSDQDEDPKNTVCPYFKQGLCQKGKKCIYSHDLTLDRNEEIDLYVDQRTQLIMNQIGTKNLNDLSEGQLGKILNQKEKQYVKGAMSDIVCKHFLDAVKGKKYGWNWTCANGGDSCKYKHCLPPGYILDPDGKIEASEIESNVEEMIDEERNKLLSENRKSALVTLQLFMEWKKRKMEKKILDRQTKKKEEEKKNKNKGILKTGRQLFTYDPTLFIDDAQAADQYVPSEEQQMDAEGEEKIEEMNEQGQQKQEIEDFEQQTAPANVE